MVGLSFHLDRGLAGLPAFRAEVNRLTGGRAQIELGSDDATDAAAAQRGTSLQALALLLFGIIVALAMLVIVGQSIARLAYTASDDFPVLRALGSSRGQLAAVALAPGALVAAAGMALAVPAAYALSVFTPVGLARRAEVSPGLSFDTPILLGGAVLLTLLLIGRGALAAQHVARTQADARARGRGSPLARWMASRGFPAPAVTGIRLAFEPASDRTAVPVRSAILGTALALGAVIAALVFGASLAHIVGDPRLAGWNWDVAVGNPHSGDTAAQTIPKLRANASLAGFTATALGDGDIGGQDVPVVGSRRCAAVSRRRCWTAAAARAAGDRPQRRRAARAAPQRRRAGPRPDHPGSSRAPHYRAGRAVPRDHQRAGQAGIRRGHDAGRGGHDEPDPSHRQRVPGPLRHPGDPAAIARLKREFPGVVLPAVPPPEVREVRGVNGLPLILAAVLTLLAVGTIAQTLVTSVRRRRRDLAILKAVGFVGRQVRASVAWQATAIAGTGLACRPAARRWPPGAGRGPAGGRIRDPAGDRHLPRAAAGRPGGPPAGQRGRGYPGADRGADPARRGAQDRVATGTDAEDPGTRNFIRPRRPGRVFSPHAGQDPKQATVRGG